jgi:hypothetical protein
MTDPLTREDLLSIQARNKGNADVRALLLEVKRLRALALRAHDYVKQSPTSSVAQLIADGLKRDFDVEPVVLEQPKL